jgi:hypothetical protein
MEARRPGLKLAFYLSFLQARTGGFFEAPGAAPAAELRPCPACGQPTTSVDVCSFCRTWDTVRTRREAEQHPS